MAMSCAAATYVVYRITNAVNGNTYIGVTGVTMEARFRRHLSEGRCNRCQYPLHRAIRKHGQGAFSVEALETHLDRDSAFSAEVRLIALHKPPYNATDGGEGVSGIKVSDETRAKMSAAKAGKPSNRKGARLTPEQRARVSAAVRAAIASRPPQKRQPWSAEHRARMMEARKGAHKPYEGARLEAHRAGAAKAGLKRRRPVVCLDTGEVFASVTIAAQAFGLRHPDVSGVVRGRRKTTGGKRFSYVEAA